MRLGKRSRQLHCAHATEFHDLKGRFLALDDFGCEHGSREMDWMTLLRIKNTMPIHAIHSARIDLRQEFYNTKMGAP